MIAPQAHLSVMKNLELSEAEAETLARELIWIIDGDRYPFSPRIMVLKEILAKLRPAPTRPAAAPEPRVYAPPRAGNKAQRWKVMRTANKERSRRAYAGTGSM